MSNNISSEDSEILILGKSRFNTIEKAENHNRKSSIEDVEFVYNVEDGQWPASIREERQKQKRPVLTSNKLRKFVAQVSNRQRDMRINLKVVPVDSEGDPETAEIYDDIIRNIEFQSKADQIYTEKGENAIAGGFGYWRVLTDFVDDSFNQELRLEGIKNSYSVYFDPRGEYCFIREGFTIAEFKEQYGDDATPLDFNGGGEGESNALWYEDDTVFVVEYFYKKPFKKEIAQVRDSETEEVKIFELDDDVTEESLAEAGFEVIKTRKVDSHKIMWAKMTGSTILEQKELPGKYIPVIEVVGDEVDIEGKQYKRSLIRDAKDPMRMYNYHLTAMTEIIGLAPKAPFILTQKQIEGHVKMWEDANVSNKPYLLYNDKGGSLKPSRERPVEVPSGAANMLNIANNDIQDVTGMFDASFGQTSNERSKVAIDARSQRSDLGTFHFIDNLNRAILHTGRILIDLIPIIYDTEQIMRVRGKKTDIDPETGQPFEKVPEEISITINKAMIDPKTDKTIIVNDLSVGKFDVREDLRSSSSKRQEIRAELIQAMQYAPEAAPVILQQLFRQQDWDGATELADEIKALTAPESQGGHLQK